MTTSKTYRAHIAFARAAVILWQAYIAVLAFRSGSSLERLLSALGAEVATSTKIYLATYQWWVVIPVACAVLAVIAVRRLEKQPTVSLLLLATEVFAALALNIFWREAWFGPLFSLINQVG